MQAKSYKSTKKREKTIRIPKKCTDKIAKMFGVEPNTVYNSLRYDFDSERNEAIRKAAFETGIAVVEVTRPMSVYDIYVSKELADPSATMQK